MKKALPHPGFPAWNKLALALLLFILPALAAACSSGADKPEPRSSTRSYDIEPSLNRADPGYMQYMEKLSMLGNATELSGVVSGSSLSWRMAGSPAKARELLQVSDTWMRVNPQTVLSPGKITALGQLGHVITWQTLTQAGISGMYLGPSGGSGAMWDNDRRLSPGHGEDVIQYGFAMSVGTDDEYDRLVQTGAGHQGLAGADLTPPATGIGPDFFLAARAVRRYPGLFCMVDVPRSSWDDLPSSLKEWDVMPLTGQQVAKLAGQKILPFAMQQDRLPYLAPTGWAATTAVRGMDGNQRRWVFRYHESSNRPILNWADPSATARMVLNGSVIRQVGFFANALSGYRIQPLIGLEAAPAESLDLSDPANFSMAKEASVSIARQVRGYGGWAWLRDELPLPLLTQFQDDGPDFVYDTIFSPAAEHALLSGRAELLRFMFDEAQAHGIDFRRLVHDSTGHEGLSYLLPHLKYLNGLGRAGASAKLRQKAEQAKKLELTTLDELKRALRQSSPPSQGGTDSLSLAGGRVYTTPAGIAASAQGLPPNVRPDAQQAAQIRRGHSLLIFFKAMQPGLLMLSAQDLTGVLPITWQETLSSPEKWDQRMASMGSIALLANSDGIKLNNLGTPAGHSLYGPIDAQIHNPASFLNEVREILRIRKRLGLASGALQGRLPSTGLSPGVFCLVTRTAGSAHAISLVNFSRQPSSFSVDVGAMPELKKAVEAHGARLMYGNVEMEPLSGSTLQLTLPSLGRALLYAGPGGA